VTAAELERRRAQALAYLRRAGIVITPDEAAKLEVADLGLGRFDEVGLTLLTYVNTERVCAKELVLLPRQLCPEHRHPAIGGEPGKEETFRCRWGRVHLVVDRPAASTPPLPDHPYLRSGHVTAAHHVVLEPGEQYMIEPDLLHWFMAGPEGAVVSEFSTRSRDAFDVFTDPRVDRNPVDGSAEG